MASKTLSDLRSHLFDCIERVKSINDPNTDDNEKMSIEQANAICHLSSEIIDSAKVEVDFIRVMAKCDNPTITSGFVNKSDLFITEHVTPLTPINSIAERSSNHGSGRVSSCSTGGNESDD